ncbi:hypothetical protein LY39_02775 [Roseinatronobacter bogoriensis subsp. barguzinensis]|nr:hypothetical protein LY39_02775 [Rhodobaca barguzinensis]TDY67643.1 hypothetical protein EV660_107156 [Rhodobaca bogoriensis DSM 18756]
MILSLCGALPSELAIFSQHSWQTERFEPMLQQDLWRLRHAAFPRFISDM